MTVYVVTSGSYSDYGIETVFSTREAAEAYIAEGEKLTYSDYNKIEEWPVDERAGFIMRPYWLVWMMKDGSTENTRELEALAAPTARSGEVGEIGNWGFQAESFVSAEHALKLAAEARQEWLRKKVQ